MNWSAASRPLSVSGADDAGATDQYANVATVTGQPVESSGLNAGPTVTDTAKATTPTPGRPCPRPPRVPTPRPTCPPPTPEPSLSSCPEIRSIQQRVCVNRSRARRSDWNDPGDSDGRY